MSEIVATANPLFLSFLTIFAAAAVASGASAVRRTAGRLSAVEAFGAPTATAAAAKIEKKGLDGGGEKNCSRKIAEHYLHAFRFI